MVARIAHQSYCLVYVLNTSSKDFSLFSPLHFLLLSSVEWVDFSRSYHLFFLMSSLLFSIHDYFPEKYPEPAWAGR